MDPTADDSSLIDVRSIPPHQRHALILSRFDALEPGAAIELLNDHEPLPLLHHFDSTRHDQFDWDLVEAGPERWHVRVGKRLGVA
jgi:uncharacterized protein (DUF2249 family)